MQEQEREFLQLNRTRILCNHSKPTILFSMIAALALCYILWPVSRHNYLIGWTGLIVSYSLIRYGIIRRQGREPITAEKAPDCLQLYALKVFISGALWGAAAIILIPYQPHALSEFTLYNGLIILVICGLVAGAVVSYSVSKRVLLCYALPALVPPAFYLISLGDRYNSALGGFVLLYLLFITASSFQLNHQYRNFISMQYRLSRLEDKHGKSTGK